MPLCSRERARVSNDNGDNAIAACRRGRGSPVLLSADAETASRVGFTRKRKEAAREGAYTSGRDSGPGEKKSGKKNYNAAARARLVVAIMRFMAAENVVAIIPDNREHRFVSPSSGQRR